MLMADEGEGVSIGDAAPRTQRERRHAAALGQEGKLSTFRDDRGRRRV